MSSINKLRQIVLSYPRLAERVKGRDDEIEKVCRIIDEIRADYSRTVTKLLVKFMRHTFVRLYDSINFDSSNDLDFEQLVKTKNVILVPNHQSHADYMALNYVIFKKYRFSVYVAGGVNLNIFGIGKLFRKCGCFFIRRSFGNDILYKLTLEAYLYYLLHEGKPIEFFFEGGRSRSGKLLSPRYGLYHMLLEAHEFLPDDKKRELVFVPVSIVHEYVPEHRTLTMELEGAGKKKESLRQLFKVFKVFFYQLGSIHIRLGKPVSPKNISDRKKQVQTLAFDCFREVGRNMLVTPSSLLALILLDGPSGALKWEEIFPRAKKILNFCDKFEIPYTKSLIDEHLERTLEEAIDLFINNSKVDEIGERNLGHVFYAVKENRRGDMLYFKNTILHHFLVPWIINVAWVNVFNGTIIDTKSFNDILLNLRRQLEYEFYLPTAKQFFFQAREVVRWCVGKEDLMGIDGVINMVPRDFYKIVTGVGVFSKSLVYIHEAYYISALTIKALASELAEFKMEDFWKKSREVYEWQKGIGRVITFSESFSKPILKNSIKYFIHQNNLICENGFYRVRDTEEFDWLLESLEKDLMDQLSFNIRET